MKKKEIIIMIMFFLSMIGIIVSYHFLKEKKIKDNLLLNKCFYPLSLEDEDDPFAERNDIYCIRENKGDWYKYEKFVWNSDSNYMGDGYWSKCVMCSSSSKYDEYPLSYLKSEIEPQVYEKINWEPEIGSCYNQNNYKIQNNISFICIISKEYDFIFYKEFDIYSFLEYKSVAKYGHKDLPLFDKLGKKLDVRCDLEKSKDCDKLIENKK